MKNPIKIAALLVTIMAASVSSKGQTSPTANPTGMIYSVGAQSDLSLGSFKHYYKWDLGGSLQAAIPVAPQFYTTVNAGYENYFGKANAYGDGLTPTNIHMLPVKAGLRYFPVKELYFQAEAGAAFALNKSEVGFDKTAAFIYAPTIGMQFPLGGNNYIDAGVKYEASTKFITGVDNSKTNTLGLRLAYAFSSK